MNIQRRSVIIPIIYLVFLDYTDSSSEETTDDNIDLSLFHKCISIIERNNSLRAAYRQARRARSLCWFNNICSSWENAEFKRYFRITKNTFEWLCTEIALILLQRNNSRGAPRLPIRQKVSVIL